MLKLKIVTDQSTSQHDTDINPSNMTKINKATLRKRGEGVGGGFNGRAPNSIALWWGPNEYRNVVLPDGFRMDNILQMTILDSKNLEPAIDFKMSEDKKVWVAMYKDLQGSEFNMTDRGPSGNSGAPKRTYILEMAIKANFEKVIGGVGVNDLGSVLSVEVQLPQASNTDEIREQIQDFCWSQREQLGVSDVPVQFQLVGRSIVTGTHMLEGDLGSVEFPEHAMAGRQQIEPNRVVSGESGGIAHVRPFANDGPDREDVAKPGENAESYGFKPKDENT